MVFVTRCPYCGTVWLLPDRETAERGPVKCSACLHSFDATSDMLQVSEDLFPDMPRPPRPDPAPVPAPEPQAEPAARAQAAAPEAAPGAPADDPAPRMQAPAGEGRVSGEAAPRESSPDVPAQAASQDGAKNPAEAPAAPGPENDTLSGEVRQSSREPEEQPVLPAIPAAVRTADHHPALPEDGAHSAPAHPQGVPLHHHAGGIAGLKVPASGELKPLAAAGLKTEPRLGALPSSGLSRDEPHLSVEGLETAEEALKRRSGPRAPGAIIPAQSAHTAQEVKVFMAAPAPASEDAGRRSGESRGAGAASIVTVLVLLVILAGVLAVIFNQRILAVFPQTEQLFVQVCGKVPCPGFYLADASAFEVSRTNLRAVDESGNYLLEITVINKSNFAQAVPSLDIVLVDDADSPLMRRTLEPRDFLADPEGTESIAPGRSMSVRFSLQTNVTPARCVVTPTFPKKDAS